MMKINKSNTEMIVRYFENELNQSEKENLISQIQLDPELRKEFDSIKRIYDFRADANNIKVNQEYLDSILPKFRAKLKDSEKKRILHPGYAYALSVFLIAMTLLFYFNLEGDKTITNLSEIPDEELLQQLSNDYIDFVREDKIDSLFNAEIKSSPEKISYYVFNGDDINNLYQKNLITPEDELEIYMTLIDKKF